MKSRLINRRAAEELLNVRQGYLREITYCNPYDGPPFYRLSKKIALYCPDELRRWAESRYVKSTKDSKNG